MLVPEIFATKLSELNKFEYLEDPLKKNKLAPKRITNTMPIQPLFNALIKFLIASTILVSINKSNYDKSV